MSDGFVRVPADSTGKRVDAQSLDDAAVAVYRQRIIIAGGSGTAEVVAITNVSAGATDYGLVVRPCTATVAIVGTVGVTGGVAISGTAQVAISTPFTINDISRTVQVAVATPFTVNNISATVTVAGNINVSATATIVNATASPLMVAAIDVTNGTRVNVGDSANNAIRVNIIAGAGSGGTAQTDGTSFNAQVSSFTPIGGIFDDAASDTLSENDAGVVRLTTNRAFHVNLRDTAGNGLGTSGAALAVNVHAISATASVILAAGTANIGTLNNISSTVTIAGIVNVSATASVVLAAGTANFGTLNDISRTVQVAVATPFTINAISATVAAAIATTSFVTVRAINGQLANPSAGTALTIKNTFTAVAAASTNSCIAAIASTQIRVLGYRIQAQGTVGIRFIATSSGANLSQRWTFQAREGIVVNAPTGCFEFQSSAGEGINISLDAAVTCDVSLVYLEI